jgi:hypothetical protein
MDTDILLETQETIDDFDWSVFGDIEEPKPDYSNAMPLDIHYRSVDARVVKAVDCLCTEIKYTYDRSVAHMQMVVLNLYKAHILDPDKYIGYSRDMSKYRLVFRYNKQRITYRPLIKVMDGLIEKGYVEPVTFSFNKVTKIGRCSRIRATDKLTDLLVDRFGFTEEIVALREDGEVIILKDDDKVLMDYTDDDVTDAMRAQVERYNEFLQKTYIDLHHDGYVPENALYVDLTAKTVRRIFNNGSFMQGGRYYGGFWMGLPSGLRQRIIINNQKVVECDYSGIHIHLLYAMEGINYGAKGKDAYTLPNYGDDNKTRQLFKTLLLSALNAATETKAIRALQEKINYNKSDYPTVIPTLKDVLSDFKEYHRPIAKYLGTGAGLELMYHDSQMAERVITEMMDNGIPVLSVHDSFICPTLNYQLLYDTMKKAYETYYADTLKCITDIKAFIQIKYSELTYDSEYPCESEYSEYYYDPSTIEDWDLVERLVYYDDRGDIPTVKQVRLSSS